MMQAAIAWFSIVVNFAEPYMFERPGTKSNWHFGKKLSWSHLDERIFHRSIVYTVTVDSSMKISNGLNYGEIVGTVLVHRPCNIDVGDWCWRRNVLMTTGNDPARKLFHVNKAKMSNSNRTMISYSLSLSSFKKVYIDFQFQKLNLSIEN